MKNILLFLLFVMSLLCYSCEVINPSEDIPAYLNVKEIIVETTTGEGSNSQSITDAWISVDDEFLGAFPLPARIPILEEGMKKITVFSGIKLNGASSDRDIYPFYNQYEVEVELIATEDVTINPVVGYSDKAVFQVVESFEGVNHLFSADLDGDDVTFFEGSSSGGFEGRSGVATMSNGHFVVSAGTDYINTFPSQSNGYTSFVEIDVKSDVYSAVYLIAYDQGRNAIYQGDFGNITPSEDWKKIYFEMSTPLQEAAQSPSADSYRLVLVSQLSPEAIDTMPVAKVYVDNVKFITF